MRVFVVDDDRDTTECMRLLFQLWGHDVRVANDGATAIEQAPLILPDLMMVDLAMPLVDGLQVARRIRQFAELARTSLVAVSGYGDLRHQKEALAAGFDECLLKPLPAAELLSLVDRVRARIEATRDRAYLSAEAVATSQARKAKAAASLQTPLPVTSGPVLVRLHKSGISDVVSLNDRGAAERLRHWLSQRGCRVGPVYESKPGEFAFFNYSRRQLRQALRDSAEFRVEE
jgi:DNA-binding response OmpR family regulator